MQNALQGSEGLSTLFLTGRAWSPPCLSNALNALMPPQEHSRAQDSPLGGWTDCN